jgi:hypothetical protein
MNTPAAVVLPEGVVATLRMRDADCRCGQPTAFDHHLSADAPGCRDGCSGQGTLTLDEARHDKFERVCGRLDSQPDESRHDASHPP